MRQLKWLSLLGLLLLGPSTYAQSVRFQSQAISTRGAGIANATVAVCTQPANTNTQPCSPLATLATSTSTTSGGANPLTADSFGNFFFYAAPGRYTVQIYGPAVFGQLVIPDAVVPPDLSGPISVTTTFSNNIFLNWTRTDLALAPTLGMDTSNNIILSNNTGKGIFFKVGGVDYGDIGAPASGNFAGNIGWNNMTINPASFGINPGSNPAGWTASAFPFGETDATQNANAFASTSQLKMNSSGTNTGNIEKGGAFFNCLDNDTTATTPPNCVGFDSLAEGPTANTNAQLWGGVLRFQIDSGGGDGSGKGVEIDGTNNGTSVNAHGDAGLKTKTGIWLASFGSQPSSWQYDVAAAAPGWLNGIAIRNVNSGGIGLQLPNNIGLYWKGPAGADLKVLNTDGSGNVLLDTAATGTSLFFRVNGSNTAIASATGWSSMTLSSPTYNNPNLLITPTAPTIAAGGCGGSAASIPVNNGTLAFKINVGTAPTSACTITMPAATTGWNCFATDITTNSTSVFLQKQTGVESTTSVTITNFNDVAVATAFVASDILKVACTAD